MSRTCRVADGAWLSAGHGMEQGKVILALSFLLPPSAPSGAVLTARAPLPSQTKPLVWRYRAWARSGRAQEQRLKRAGLPAGLGGINLRIELINPTPGESSPVSPFPGSKPPFRQGLSLQIPSLP